MLIMKIKFFLLFLIILSFNLWADFSVKINVAPKNITVGDTIRLSIDIQGTYNTLIPSKEDLSKLIEPFEILSENYNPSNKKQDIIISIYKTGEFELSSFPVKYSPYDTAPFEILYTDTEYIKVNSVVNSETEPVFKEFESPFNKKYDYSNILILSVLIILLLSLLSLYIRYFKRNKISKSENKIIKLDPYQNALLKLKNLKQMQFYNNSDFKIFAFELSFVIREFLGAIKNIDCLEMSNSELKYALKNIEFIMKSDFLEINDWLEPIKYAKYIPPLKTISMYLDITEKFIYSQKEHHENSENNI